MFFKLCQRSFLKTSNSSHRGFVSGLQNYKGKKRAARLLWVIPVATFCLGTWQVKRLFWKRDLIKNVNDELKKPPEKIDTPSIQALKNATEFRKVLLKGSFIPSRTVILGPRSIGPRTNDEAGTEGGLFSTGTNNGYYVLTPFRLCNSNITILVNRGWIPLKAKDEFSFVPWKHTPKGNIEIEAVARSGEKDLSGLKSPDITKDGPFTPGPWPWLNLDQIARVAECHPILFELVASNDVESVSQPNVITPIPKCHMANIRNKHLEYIITWYGISFISTMCLLFNKSKSWKYR